MIESWLADIAAALNTNQGVVTVALFGMTLLGGPVRAVFANGRNPEAPTYGTRRPVQDFSAAMRALAQRLFAGSGKSAEQAVTIGYFGFAFDYLPLFLARRFRSFDSSQLGAKVRFRLFRSYDELASSIDNGEVQFVAMSSVPATRLLCAGANISAIEALSAHAQCIVSPWPNVSVLRDLAEARIATVKFSSSHFGALNAFESAGLKHDESRFLFVDEEKGRELIRQREVAGWAIWPLHSDFEIECAGAREVIGSEVPVYSLLVVVGDLNDKSLFHARIIRDGIRDAKTWIVQNRKKAASFARREFGVPRSVVTSAWRRFSFGTTLNESTSADLEQNAEVMVRNGWFSPEGKERLKRFVRSI